MQIYTYIYVYRDACIYIYTHTYCIYIYTWTSDDFTLVTECAFLFVQVVAANANLFRLFAILVGAFVSNCLG